MTTSTDLAEVVGGAEPLVAGPGRGGFGYRFATAVWPKLLAITVVLAVWELIVLSGWQPSFVLPGPAAVADNLVHQLHGALLWQAVATTMSRAVAGFALAALIGSVAGALIARNRLLRNAFGPMITGLQTMPAIAWFPFAIIFFGLNTSAILFVIVIGAAPSVAIGVISGVDHISPLLLRAAATLHLRSIALYRYVIVPAALPMFVAGLKQGWAFAWRSLMAGELVVLVANTSSIGVLLENAQNLSDMPSAIAIMTVILLIGIVVDAVFSFADLQVRRRWGLLDEHDA
ncbi:ABC transporter permease [Mycobacterium sp. Aquia_213]|uniref:ABC transporter permease n=1 Tax=Mycobacterium sp. Aquia_213 TaxID=2991728 RepID=UPI00226DAB0E|nr:ABC transporter permease [Mycobacterium sp. Aquia_213]WAC91538.1 ABC transporter permease [Mycobacterium sp. Aquia_213]